MAIRLIADADLAALRAIWSEYRTAEGAAYARDHGWTLATVQRWLDAANRWLAIDPATETVGVFMEHPDARGEVVFIGTRTTGALAARRAADAMVLWAAERAFARGLSAVFGHYIFPPGTDWAATRAVRYFGDSLTSTTVEAVPEGDGGMRVTITAPDIPGLIAELQARLP